MFDVIRSTVDAFLASRAAPWQSLGDVLLVGEGNLSFSKNLFTVPGAFTEMTATIFESKKDLSDEIMKNVQFLENNGVQVLFGVDVAHLEKSLNSNVFDTIIFQFPNVGSREPKYGHNPNHVLIRKFLDNARPFLNSNGKIMITAVDNSYYRGAFQFEEAAQFSGYQISEIYPFDFSIFPEYSHTNTNDDDSAAKDHKKFSTWVFRLKE